MSCLVTVSPDLPLLDFFSLWGHVKVFVYSSKPCSVDELKVRMREKICNSSNVSALIKQFGLFTKTA